jgi:hypothetical protein
MFDSELQCLSELYSRLSTEFASLSSCGKPGDASATAGCILRNEDLFARLEQMNSRLLELAAKWEQLSPQLDPASRRQTQQLAGKVREQAVRLASLGEERIVELETLRGRLGWELGNIKMGARYLESVKPLKTNYPKFIDSRS